MERWTPLRHARAIGDWPLQRTSPFSGSIPRWMRNSTTHIPGHAEGDKPESTEYNSDSTTHRRHEDSRDLPLPPFMRSAPRLKDKAAVRAFKRKMYNTYKPGPIDQWWYQDQNLETVKSNMKRAPFSTAFHQNPYAHALATPVRHDSITGARLPLSCLIDFHLTDTGGSGGYSLLPVSMAAELVSKKSKAYKRKDAMDASLRWKQESVSYKPTGSASYVIGKKRAMDFITAHHKSTLSRRIVNMRVRKAMAEQNIGDNLNWREDMPEFVLQNLRKVVAKKLSYFLRNKQSLDARGLISALPGGSRDIRRLNDMDGAMCVLRLNPVELSDREDTGRRFTANERPSVALATQDSPSSDTIGHKASQNEDVGDHEDASLEDHPPAMNFSDSSRTPVLFSDAQMPFADYYAKEPFEALNVQESETPHTSNSILRSNTASTQSGWWSQREWFLGDQLSLQPLGTDPSATYFSTLPYRNQRLPAYNLPHLLGDDLISELRKNTIFHETDYVVVLRSRATVPLQIWLLKLANYFNGAKESAFKV